MNDVLKTIDKRYSCRAFSNKPVPEEYFAAIAKAAISSPSAVNACPWQITVLQNQQIIAELETAAMKTLSQMPDKSMFERIQSRGGKVFYGATGMVLVAVDPQNQKYALIDSGIVVENVALACTSLGLGNVINGMLTLAFAGENKEELKQKLNIKPELEVIIGVIFGFEENAEGKPHTPDLGKLNIVK